jgi:hypothetical protein
MNSAWNLDSLRESQCALEGDMSARAMNQAHSSNPGPPPEADSGTAPAAGAPEGVETPSKGRARQKLSDGWQLAVVAYRDPEHVSERIALHSTTSLGDDSLAWAQRVRHQQPGVARAVIAEQLRTDSAKVAAIDGGIAGTPFLIALVPGYLAYLRQEARMLLRTAALYDRDPRELDTAAEMLALRGVHPSVDAARAALLSVQDAPLPEKPTARRPWRTWVRSVSELLIFGGFLSAPSDKRKEGAHAGLKTAIAALFGLAVWVITWVFPLSFMLAMGWGCDSNARDLGKRAITFYDKNPDSAQAAITAAKQQRDAGRTKRQILRTTLLVLSVAIPIAFIAFVDHERQTTGITPLTAVGGLVALSLVIATTMVATRR